MNAYPMDVRRRVLDDCDRGMNTLAVAVKHDVSPAWVRRLKQRRRESGEIAPRPPIKKKPPKWQAYADQLHAFIREQPDITLREIREQLGIEISLQSLSVALRRLKFTLKKKSCGLQSKTARTSR
jgi:transposase